MGAEGSLNWSFSGTVAGGTVTGQSWKDPDNVEFGLAGTTTGLLGPFSPIVFSTTGSAPHGPLNDPYAMTIRMVITGPGLDGTSIFSGDFNLQNVPELAPVPEPASWALFGLGLGVLGVVLRWRRIHK